MSVMAASMTNRLPAFGSTISKGPYGQYMSAFHQLSGVGATVLKLAQPPGDYPDPPSSDLVLAMALRPSRGRFRIGGKNVGDTQPQTGLGIVLPGLDTDLIFDTRSEFLALAVDGTVAARIVDPENESLDALMKWTHAPIVDTAIPSVLRGLWDVLETSDERGGTLFGDTAVLTILSLLRNIGETRPAPSTGGLAPGVLRRSLEMLDFSSGGTDPDLATLAAAAGLSPQYFCRAFKASTGHPPHRWLIRRRIERACDLLSQASESVADVSYAVGYDDPAYFSRLFTRETGQSPRAWRVERRS